MHDIKHRLPDSSLLAQLIAENSVHGLAMMDAQGYCLYANQAWLDMTGFTLEEFATKPLHDLVHHHHPDGRPFPMSECPIGCTLGKNMVVRGHEDLFFRKDGSAFPVACAATPVLKDGAPILMILEVRDISEDKRARERLQEVDRRKDEFLAMLAHELRNPMAPIRAAAELLRRAPGDEALVRRASAVIERQVGHMVGLVDDLLDVSRVTRNMVVLDQQRVDMKRVLAEAIEQSQPLIDMRRHSLLLHMPQEPACVLGDQMRLVQIVANLLNNAAKFTPDGGTISLRMEAIGTRVALTVSDTGIGMEQDMVEHAFELFMQAKRASDRAQGGLGLGLALVRSLVALHGGAVSCWSPGPGKGSSFEIVLPRLAEQDAQAAAVAAQAGPQHAPARILLVDDNHDAASTLAMLLESMGHEVAVEHDPASALALAGADPRQVYILDIGLPGMDGNVLARRLRERPENAAATMIALTGYSQERDRGNAAAARFDHYLVKPVDTGALAALLAGSTGN